MSSRDKRHCLEIFWKWRWYFIHRRWCQENMSNSIITRTHRLWIIHFAIKRRRDNVKKKTENVNEDTIWNEIVTSDQLVNAMQGTFSYADPGCTNFFNLFCRKKNRKLEFNDTVFFVICQYRKEVRNAYKGGGLVEAMYCLLNITLIYPIFANIKNPIFLYNCCQKWLDNLHYLLSIQIVFCSRLSLPSRNPKQQTVEWVIAI
jgi:hypothetical protein